MTAIQNNLTDEVQKVLNHFKKLFNYKSIYLFPDVQDNLISPIVLIDAEVQEPYKHNKKISWLNYYQEILTRETIDNHLSITEFLNYYRINQAKRLLLLDKDIGEIGYECGFESQSYFNRVFKKIVKETPLAFRKKYMNY